jgi:hypothetical protein
VWWWLVVVAGVVVAGGCSGVGDVDGTTVTVTIAVTGGLSGMIVIHELHTEL